LHKTVLKICSGEGSVRCTRCMTARPLYRQTLLIPNVK